VCVSGRRENYREKKKRNLPHPIPTSRRHERTPCPVSSTRFVSRTVYFAEYSSSSASSPFQFLFRRQLSAALTAYTHPWASSTPSRFRSRLRRHHRLGPAAGAAGAALGHQRRHVRAAAGLQQSLGRRGAGKIGVAVSGGGVSPLGKDLDRRSCAHFWMARSKSYGCEKEATWQAETRESMVQSSSGKRLVTTVQLAEFTFFFSANSS
jgi:hypothetical protein